MNKEHIKKYRYKEMVKIFKEDPSINTVYINYDRGSGYPQQFLFHRSEFPEIKFNDDFKKVIDG